MRYDLIVVGGGLAGSALAKGIAERGARVLLLEREQRFRDRVRGEGTHPWGVSEARALGLYDVASHRYAAEHDRYYGALHTIMSWLTEVIYGLGPEADRIRAHALPQLADGSGPDIVGVGPDFPVDEATRIRFLGA